MIYIKYILINNSNYISELDEISKYEYIEKKSKFICYIFNVNSKNDAINKIESIRKSHYSAKHVVYLYNLIENNNEVLKFSDDGEPQGTGTKAILDMIQKENLTNICVVIVRYFGGILLGAGPLARAYLKSFKMAYEQLEKTRYINYIPYTLKLNYENQKNIDYILDKYENENLLILKNKKYDDNITYELDIAEQIYSQFSNQINDIK